ncbi:MAG: hypothetical protein ACJAS4_000463 [Bacteriovoracaceae bacterium]|jgi:hypothetical protein
MSEFSAGKEALSYCGKCKLPLGHTIVSMKDTATIGKVQCNTCQAVHMYKDPASKAKKVKAAKTTRKRATKKSVSVGELWMEQMGKASGQAKSYSIRERFESGDLIDHKKFGPGIVQTLVDDKMEVLFEHEMKLLVHGK